MNSEETPEAKKPKDDILDNLEKILEKDEFEEIEQRFETQLNLFQNQPSLSLVPMKSYFSITANVLEENKEGQNVASVRIIVSNISVCQYQKINTISILSMPLWNFLKKQWQNPIMMQTKTLPTRKPKMDDIVSLCKKDQHQR